MDTVKDFFEEFLAILALVIPALESIAKVNAGRFWLFVVLSVVFAVVMYFIMLGFGRLIIKNYTLTFPQKIAWAIASVLSGLAVLFWIAGQNLSPGLDYLLTTWKNNLESDQDWSNRNYGECYEAVKRLGIEDFSKHPAPGLGVNTSIPLSSPESRMMLTRTMVNGAVENFSKAFPTLGRLLDVDDGLDTPSSELKIEVDKYFAQAEFNKDGFKILPRAVVIEMCSDTLRDTFQTRLDSLETLVFLVAILVPIFTWFLLLIWVICRSRSNMQNLIATIDPR